MALLYTLLWRLLLVLVHVNRALICWLRGRLRSWKGRVWERAMAALLLPLALTGLPEQQKKSDHNPEANAEPLSRSRAGSRQSRWLSDGRALEKLPVHIGLLVAEEEPSYTDMANLVVWCMAVGISHISVYDNHGKYLTHTVCVHQTLGFCPADVLLGLHRSWHQCCSWENFPPRTSVSELVEP